MTPGPRVVGYWSLDDMNYIVCDEVTRHHLLTPHAIIRNIASICHYLAASILTSLTSIKSING